MKGEKNNRNAVWIYAVILFTSAFIILLVTAYSQIKLNNNIDEYKNQLSTEENAKNSIQTNLGAALNENKKLNEELNNLKKEKEDLKKEIENENTALKKQQQKSSASLNAYDMLIIAQVEYDTGNFIKSADILYSKTDSKLLGKSGIELYEELISKVYEKASEVLYIEGYKNYMNSKYEDAINCLERSFNYTSDKYFSDDCLYFIAYSYFRLENKNGTKVYMQKLIDMYPNSSYIKEAVHMIKEIG